MGLPCFSAGVTPASPVKNGPGTVNLSIVVGGLCVEAGDVVIGDIDGVVVIPYARLDAVIHRLTAIRAAEAALVARVNAGLGVPDWVDKLFSGGRVEEVD